MNIIKSIFKPRDKPKNHRGDSIGGRTFISFRANVVGKICDGTVGCADNGSICVCFVSYLKRSQVCPDSSL